MSRLVLSFGVFMCFSYIYASSDFNGQFFVNSFSALNSDKVEDDFLQNSTNIWLSGDIDWGDTYSVSGTITASSVDSSEEKYHGVHFDFRELYLEIKKQKWLFHIGRKMMSWGKADGINPTDVLSSRDYRVYVTDFEQNRVAPTGFFFEYMPYDSVKRCAKWKRFKKRNSKDGRIYRKCVRSKIISKRSKQSLTLAVVPNFEPSVWGGISTETQGEIIFHDQERPPATLENTDLALKWDYHSTGWEASILGFSGHNHTPNYRDVDFQAVPPSSFRLELEPTYSRLYVLGGSFSKSYSDLVFKAEAAYKQTSNNDGLNMYFSPSSVETVSGVEWGIGDRHRVIAQGFLIHFPRYTEIGEFSSGDTLRQSVAELNSQLHFYSKPSRYGLIANWIYNNEDAGWKVESSVIYNIVLSDYFVNFKSVYMWTDSLEFNFGTQLFGGPDDSPFGILDGQNTVYIESKYWF